MYVFLHSNDDVLNHYFVLRFILSHMHWHGNINCKIFSKYIDSLKTSVSNECNQQRFTY